MRSKKASMIAGICDCEKVQVMWVSLQSKTAIYVERARLANYLTNQRYVLPIADLN